MTEQRIEHWARSEDLREQFVRAEIAPSARRAMESHLAECPECRFLVDSERALAHGVQQAGRAALRKELQARLARRRGIVPASAWRWAAVAATLIAAIGVWRLYAPISSPEDVVPPSPTVSERSIPDASPPVPAAETKGPASVSGKELSASRRETGVSEMADAAPDAVSQAAGAAERDEVLQLQKAEAMGETISEAWTVGSVIPEERIVTAREAGKDMKMESRAPAVRPKVAPQESKKGKEREFQPALVQLRQMAFGGLSQARQVQAQQSPGGTVPVRLTQRGDSLIVDLYVGALYPDETVRQARLMLPAADSLVVEIEGQRIAIRLPSGFTAR